MQTTRRQVVVATAALAAVGGFASARETSMYGLIGKFTAQPGRRDELIAILLEGVQAMPGCLSYVVAKDPKNPDAIWITEVWESRDSHQASLQLPSVREAIAKAMPLIAGMEPGAETEPVGGWGLQASG